MQIEKLWYASDPRAWNKALECYWDHVKHNNMALEKAMENLDRERLRRMDKLGWYEFLRDEYFRWKYTAPNRYATTTAQLRKYEVNGGLSQLDRIRELLLEIDTMDVRKGLEIARHIRGLGTSGASGLLALMYPNAFATVDQFVVKALLRVLGLPEAAQIARMKPESLTIKNAAILIAIIQKRARDNNHLFATTNWTRVKSIRYFGPVADRNARGAWPHLARSCTSRHTPRALSGLASVRAYCA